jgi:prepilin-type N-terminal cleavage/methylation domain-containing protein
MFQRALAKKRSGEGGFTLVELLIVIVILGILAAIVVLAIGGLSGTAQKSSCNAAAKAISSAEDAFFASPDPATGQAYGHYADGSVTPGVGLLDPANKLLKTDPATQGLTIAVTGGGTGWQVTPTAGGKCVNNLNPNPFTQNN